MIVLIIGPQIEDPLDSQTVDDGINVCMCCVQSKVDEGSVGY